MPVRNSLTYKANKKIKKIVLLCIKGKGWLYLICCYFSLYKFKKLRLWQRYSVSETITFNTNELNPLKTFFSSGKTISFFKLLKFYFKKLGFIIFNIPN